MATRKALRLGAECTEKATGLNGAVTHWLMDMGGKITYLFQPKRINPDTGQPVSKLIIEIERIQANPKDFEEVDIPIEILGSHVADKASGFNGMAVAFIRHLNGCFHVQIQPSGVLQKTNSPIAKMEFDLRQCKGEKIVELTPEEMKESKAKRPSPTGDTFSGPSPQSITGETFPTC